MNQNIDSYIDYMENIAYLISSNEDVQDYLFDEKIDNEGRYRILNQLQTIWTAGVIFEMLVSSVRTDGC